MDPSFYLQAWVETHERPFLIIDEAFHVVTANRAYERSFGCARGSAEGKLCFELSHRETEPCELRGEDCPLAYARSTGCAHSCLHAHYDADGEVRLVRVHLAPIIAADGNRYYAESVEEIQPAERPTGRGVGEPQMVGRSPLFLEVMEVLNAAARSAGPFLMAGERGTCKEHAARFVHYHSERSTGPFLGVNCAAVPEPLLESELFGHEGGAVTGGIHRCSGVVTLAHGGTLFLDEVGMLPLPVQERLLHLLERREVRRRGDEDGRTLVDVRIVAATTRPLWQEVAEGRFLNDLFHRIACFTVELPPLRDRMGDLPLIAKELLRHIPPPPGDPGYRISKAAVEVLQSYPFPGNVAELRKLLQVAIIYSPTGRIGVDAVRRAIREHQERATTEVADRVGIARGPDAPAAPAELERIHLATLLARHDGHRRRTAETLGISERTLYRKLKRYGL